MALAPGSRLGAYEILTLIGSGGMGEVYRGRDARLGRDVAIKALPDSLAADPERLARFEREARTLAALNHPNIAHIYGVEDSTGVPALVMEFVEGPTLAERIAKGPIPLDEALPIAKQIAEALEAAHEQGIIHRDLKPANIKVRPDATVKVLDFGLAKAFDPAPSRVGNPSMSPTLSVRETMAGLILGTAAYMSPEQARARPVDKRTDIWAFGCVLYEMLTGRRAFHGASVTETLAAILERQPDWSVVPARTPTAVARVLKRCLEKDTAQRLHDIADARLDINEALLAPTESVRHPATRRWIAPSSVLVAVAAGILLGWNIRPSTNLMTQQQIVTRSTILVSPASLEREISPSVALSPDGRTLVYVAELGGPRQLYVRPIDALEGKSIPQTDNALSPFFSSDGRWIAFFADGKLKKVFLQGGVPVSLCDVVTGPPSGSWGADDNIYFTSSRGIARVSASGGSATVVLSPQSQELAYRWPEVLPDSRAVLYTTVVAGRAWADDADTYVHSFTTGQRRLVVKGAGAHYVSTGHLIFARSNTLFATSFDASTLEARGKTVPIVDGIMQTASGAPHVGVSVAGSMVYVAAVPLPARSLVSVARTGAEQALKLTARAYAQPRLSPDGSRIAVVVDRGAENNDIWLYTPNRETFGRLTFEGDNDLPLWFPDGRRLTFNSNKDGPYAVYSKPVDGSAPEERLLALQAGQTGISPLAWSPDGRALAFVVQDPVTRQDIFVFVRDGEPKVRPVLNSRFREGAPVFSPDGRWLAYVSDESGRLEIYVQPFPGPGEKWQISTDGGVEPTWPRHGTELFYRNGDRMMAVTVKTNPGFVAGQPRALFTGPYEKSTALFANYDVSADGSTFLMVKGDPSQSINRIVLIQNWTE